VTDPFVLDTNVVSELLRPVPHPAVAEWMRRHGEHTYLTTVTRAQLRYGAARLPTGARKRRIEAMVEEVLAVFDADTLPFDVAAADSYADITADRERAGRPRSMADTMIAAICVAHDCALATGNVQDFDDAGLRALVNPFESSQ
jgi:predicted nucleic acid-binding protein